MSTTDDCVLSHHRSLLLDFLDHALRQQPSETMKLIKRTLFNEYSETRRLNSYSEAIKGIYSAIRLSEVTVASPSTGRCDANVDSVNPAWWNWTRCQCRRREPDFLGGPKVRAAGSKLLELRGPEMGQP